MLLSRVLGSVRVRCLSQQRRLCTAARSSSAAGKALVVGGSGSLGKAVVGAYIDAGWATTNCDVIENPDATENIALDGQADWKEQAAVMDAAVDNATFDAIVCCAGGWAAARVATNTLAPNGLVALTGSAVAAEEGTPGMIAYGISKAATHQIVRSLAVEDALPRGCTALGVLPVTIDTASNRAAMPDEDHSNWTPPEELAAKLLGWQHGHRPRSGSLVKVETFAGESTWTVVGRTHSSKYSVD